MKLKHRDSEQVIIVDKDRADLYKASGWVEQKAPEPAPEKPSKKPSK